MGVPVPKHREGMAEAGNSLPPLFVTSKPTFYVYAPQPAIQ